MVDSERGQEGEVRRVCVGSVGRSVGWLGYTIFHVITDIKCQKIFALSVALARTTPSLNFSLSLSPFVVHLIRIFSRAYPPPSFSFRAERRTAVSHSFAFLFSSAE